MFAFMAPRAEDLCVLRAFKHARPLSLILFCLACASAHPGCARAPNPAAVSAAQQAAPQPPAVREFLKRVDDYVALHRRLELALPPLKEADDPGHIEKRCKALAAAIRKARPDAKQGDIFVESVIPHF